jgi:NitT/TauT family transport system substrate-binding protein
MTSSPRTPAPTSRRRVLQAGAAGAASIALAGALRPARADDKILIGFWPNCQRPAAVHPRWSAASQGGRPPRGGRQFASAQQVAEAMIAGRVQGSANGTASAALALAEITSPDLFKIICSNPSNRHLVLDQFVVPKDSPVKSIAELAGKRIASGPGIQNVTLARVILEKNGIADPKVTELPIGQHVPALAAGQLDAVYTLEPTGTAGRLKGLTRVLENGVIAKYVLGDADAPWFGGSASVTTAFLKDQPELAKKYVPPTPRRWTGCARTPPRSRKHMDGFTPSTNRWSRRCRCRASRSTTSSQPATSSYFQKFFDVFTERKIFASGWT